MSSKFNGDSLPPIEGGIEEKPIKTTAAKAVVGAAIATAVAFLGVLSTALDDGVVTGQEWVSIALATVIALGGVGGVVYAVPNRPKG